MIKGDYLLHNYLADVNTVPPERVRTRPQLQLVGSVHIEAAAQHSLNEVLWIQHLSDFHYLRTGQRGFPHALSAYADLTQPKEELHRLFTEYSTQFSHVRGIRQILNFHPTRSEYQLVPSEYLSNPQWEYGLSLLASFNFHFELHVFATQLLLAYEVMINLCLLPPSLPPSTHNTQRTKREKKNSNNNVCFYYPYLSSLSLSLFVIYTSCNLV
jgi:predicted TIM-barrel fold metal-dependent hydrolase